MPAAGAAGLSRLLPPTEPGSVRRGLLETLAAAAVGVAAAGLVLLAYGAPVAEGLRLLLLGAWGYPSYLLGRAAPLVLTGLAFALPLHAGLFNIGGEGAAYLGALAALAASLAAGGLLGPLPGLAAGAAAGAALGLLIAVLRTRLGVNEVVSSIMLNWTLYYMTIYTIVVALADPLYPQQSLPTPPDARLPGGPPAAFTLAALAALAGHVWLHLTRQGYAARVTGYSEKTSLYAGLDPRRAREAAMLLAGAAAGLAGATIVQALPTYSIDVALSSLYGTGFTGISVALLARNQPLATPPAALFIASLVIGGQLMEEGIGTPPELADLVTGVIVAALAAPHALHTLPRLITRRRHGRDSGG